MLDVSTILVDRSTLVLWVCEHKDILRDNLARAFRDLPDFVIFAREGAVFRDGAAFGDEPGHVEDFEFAIVVVPDMISISKEKDEPDTDHQLVALACLLLSYLLMISVP